MKITRENYEQYFLDYFDHHLSDDDQRELFLFLQENPDLREEFDMFENVKLEPPVSASLNIKGDLKSIANQLQFPEGINNFSEWSIAVLEGDLSQTEIQYFKSVINSRPALKKDYELFCSTKLVSDKRVVFNFKDELKKKESKVIPLYYYLSAVAAALAILVGLFLYLIPNEDQYKQEGSLAKIDNIPVVSPAQDKDTAEAFSLPVSKGAVENINVRVAVKNEKLPSDKIIVPSQRINDVDSVVHQPINVIVQAEQPDSVLQDIVYEKINPVQAYLIEEEVELSEPEEAKEPVSKGWKVARLLVNGFNKITGNSVEFKAAQKSNAINYELAVGKFEVSGTRGISAD